MRERINDILDDEVRIIGAGPKKQPRRKRKWIFPLVVLALVLLMGGIVIAFWPREKRNEPVQGVYDRDPYPGGVYYGIVYPSDTPKKQPLSHFADAEESFTEKIDTTINDIPLSIFIPHKAMPELLIGKPNPKDTSIILIAQAADIRSDNLNILGSFVYKGEVIAKGTSKKGFCAIIDGTITIGVDDSTPLFEKSTDNKNYFFRQFGLVDEGSLVENELKNKSIRKALCSRGEEIFIVTTGANESLHDFAQALVDLGCENAISLVGSSKAYGWYIAPDKYVAFFGENIHKYKNENYILWRK